MVRINGEAFTAFRADTLPLPPIASLTFRMRFTGEFVGHGQALDHEDMGMMAW